MVRGLAGFSNMKRGTGGGLSISSVMPAGNATTAAEALLCGDGAAAGCAQVGVALVREKTAINVRKNADFMNDCLSS